MDLCITKQCHKMSTVSTCMYASLNNVIKCLQSVHGCMHHSTMSQPIICLLYCTIVHHISIVQNHLQGMNNRKVFTRPAHNRIVPNSEYCIIHFQNGHSSSIYNNLSGQVDLSHYDLSNNMPL